MRTIAFLVCFLTMTGLSIAQTSSPNWSGRYAPCNRHSDLLNREHLDLAVRISTSNTVLAQQFAMAMDFWSGILDLKWHQVDSDDCSIQLLDGTPAVFRSKTLLRSLPGHSSRTGPIFRAGSPSIPG